MNAPQPIPAQAIAPLRERLAQLRAEFTELDGNPQDPDFGRSLRRHQLANSIAETEALIKRLEASNGTRRP